MQAHIMLKHPTHVSDIHLRIQALNPVVEALIHAEDTDEKLRILEDNDEDNDFLQRSPALLKWVHSLGIDEQYVVKSIILLGQGSIVFRGIDADVHSPLLVNLLEILLQVENFYSVIGGIVGYHLTVLKLIDEKHKEPSETAKMQYRMPTGLNLSQNTSDVRQSVRRGVAAMAQMAEIYPVGGAGDRLDLHDDSTGEALPVAALHFAGRSLLEGLMQDLQAREYLHYKIFDEQLVTPIAMMTSQEKNNHQNIINLCKDHQWFGRDSASIRFFTQPLVPVMTIEGDWVMRGPMQLMMKPGGHGVMWKLAMDDGIFDWFLSQNRHQALVRQINNPIAGTDNGLTAFTGYGSYNNKTFGFASCQRRLNAAEGMDVLIETVSPNGADYSITNVEYTEFKQRGLQDVPVEPEGLYSQYPANTNILFVDLKAIQPIVEKCPVPGMLINMKSTVKTTDADGKEKTIAAGRLESTMQNIADLIIDHFPKPLKNIKPEDLSTFITFNDRRKTLSVTKKAATPEGSLLETPEGCFYELLQNHFDVLTNFCHMKVPNLSDEKHYRQHGPAFLARLHPAIGPLYEIISQKIRGGSLADRSELQLEISEVDLEDVHVEGCLLILAHDVMGKKTKEGVIEYGEDCGKCTLKSVKVKNKGIDHQSANNYCMYQIERKEALKITLHGNAEFFAENVVFNGNLDLEVKSGHRMVAYMRGDAIHYRVEKISAPTWYWKYSFDANDHVILKRINPSIV